MPMLTPSIIAREALMILENNLVASSLVFKGDTQNFLGAKVGDTITIRKPATFTVNEFSSTITTQAVNETSTTITLEKHFDISPEITTKQATLELNDFSEQVIRPAMIEMADAIDSYLYTKYVEIYETVGDGNLNAVSDLAAVDRKLMQLKVPNSGRVGLLDPLTKEKFLSVDNLVRLDTRGGQGLEGLTNASLGRVMGLDWYAAQNVKTHTAGVPGGTPVGTAAAGASVVAVASGGNAGTYKKGDIVKFANHAQTYVVTADLTLSGTGTGNLNIAPALVSAVSSQGITLTATHVANIVGHPRGLSLVSVPLENPLSNSAVSATLGANGVNIRVVYDYDISTKKNVISFDCILGAKVTDPRLLARFLG